MKISKAIQRTAMLLALLSLLGYLALALAGAQDAEERQRFPAERSQPASCAEVEWNEEMLRDHPIMIDACREVVVADGKNWARFPAQFVRVERDGSVLFRVRDPRTGSREEIRLVPASGQVAYIDDRPTPFNRLRSTDTINLYAPEGMYGLATQPGAPRDELATVAADGGMPVTSQPTVAQRAPMPEQLPQTAGPLPWVALGGLISLLAAFGLTLRRFGGRR